MSKEAVSMRLQPDLLMSIDVMAQVRGDSRTELIERMLYFALAHKEMGCPHDSLQDRICTSCGKHFKPDPTDF